MCRWAYQSYVLYTKQEYIYTRNKYINGNGLPQGVKWCKSIYSHHHHTIALCLWSSHVTGLTDETGINPQIKLVFESMKREVKGLIYIVVTLLNNDNKHLKTKLFRNLPANDYAETLHQCRIKSIHWYVACIVVHDDVRLSGNLRVWWYHFQLHFPGYGGDHLQIVWITSEYVSMWLIYFKQM